MIFKNKIDKMVDKNRCYDIFQMAKVGNLRMYEPKTIKKRLEFKFERNNRVDQYLRLKLVLSLGAVRGEFLIKIFLRIINLAKEIFVLNIEQGQEVFIPLELTQDNYPHSFRFYDPILQLIQENCTQVKREHFILKGQLQIERIKEENRVLRIKDALLGTDESAKLTFKHTQINAKKDTTIDPLQSEHSMGVQRSKYITIENELDRMKKQYDGLIENNHGNKIEEKLNLRYC